MGHPQTDGPEPEIAALVNSLRLRVPAWSRAALKVRPLNGGMTNHNYLVEAGDRSYVLRIGGNNTELLGISRDHEYAATIAASLLGVGPEAVAYLLPEQFLVTRFIPGRAIDPARIREGSALARIAAVLRRLHGGPAIAGSFWSFRVVEQYAATALRYGVPLPALAEPVMAAAHRIETALFPTDSGGFGPPHLLRPCHNDLLNGNFLDCDENIVILDWEYAGMGDPYFDLANFSSNHDFDQHADRLLLSEYFETAAAPEQYARLQLMRIMSLFREAMWGVVQQGISTVGFDYVTYTHGYLERLAAQVSDPSFEIWLEEGARDTRLLPRSPDMDGNTV